MWGIHQQCTQFIWLIIVLIFYYNDCASVQPFLFTFDDCIVLWQSFYWFNLHTHSLTISLSGTVSEYTHCGFLSITNTHIHAYSNSSLTRNSLRFYLPPCVARIHIFSSSFFLIIILLCSHLHALNILTYFICTWKPLGSMFTCVYCNYVKFCTYKMPFLQ